MKATLDDIAKKANVSRSTAQWVMSGRGGEFRISAATCQRVLKAGEELHYHPSFSARATRQGKTQSLGFICGDINTPYYSEMAAAILHEADAKGYHLIISVTEWDLKKERDAISMLLLGGKVDGVIVAAGGLLPGTREYDAIVEQHNPLVLLNVHTPGLACIRSRWEPGMDEAVCHLKSRGHTAIAYAPYKMPPIPGSLNHDIKQADFIKACERHGLRHRILAATQSQEELIRLGTRTAARPGHPSAIIAYSDYAAARLIRGVAEAGLEVPRDLAIIGIDGTAFGAYYNPPLTSISCDIPALARGAIDQVIGLITGRQTELADTQIPTKLVIRGST